jgi:hypothetical protein
MTHDIQKEVKYMIVFIILLVVYILHTAGILDVITNGLKELFVITKDSFDIKTVIISIVMLIIAYVSFVLVACMPRW